MEKIVSIDTGNRLIKTPNIAFPSSFIESGYLPSMGGDVLIFEGKTYTLVDQSLPVLNDKTENSRFFVLSLFAIGKELVSEADMVRKLSPLNPDEPKKIKLLIGLPLQHYEAYKMKFAKYYTDRVGVIKFVLNQKPYAIQIIGAHVYPQAYAAAVTAHDKLMGSNIVNVIDVGGFTVDCLQMNGFKPNMALCTSIYLGVNTLFQAINDQMRSMGGQEISSNIIEGILKKDPAYLSQYSQKRVEIITSAGAAHAQRLLAEIAQKQFDLEEDTTVFMGGGSILLKEYILKANRAKKPIFIDDVHANARGYRMLYDMQNGRGGSNADTS